MTNICLILALVTAPMMIFGAVILGFRIGSGEWPWERDTKKPSSKPADRPKTHSQYLVAVWRDEPFRHIIDVRDNLGDAAKLAEHFRQQWSHVYLAEVIAGDGPTGHLIVESLASSFQNDYRMAGEHHRDA